MLVIPIIAMTAHAMNGDRERYFVAGMDGYVAKPMKAEDLYAVIAHLRPGGEASPGDNAAPPVELVTALLAIEETGWS